MSQNYPGQSSYYGPTHTMHSQGAMQGQKHAQMSLVFGIIGLFFFGIVFGPLAIIQAGKAEKYNQASTIGKVLGWISTIWALLLIVGFFLFFGALFGLQASQ
ncbi:hypothetical protein [Arthrobacter sp. TMN-50]